MKKYFDHTYAECPEPKNHHKAKHRNINACDHGHSTPTQVRLLPLGGGGNVIVCFKHYQQEMKFRQETGGKIMSWHELKIYNGGK